MQGSSGEQVRGILAKEMRGEKGEAGVWEPDVADPGVEVLGEEVALEGAVRRVC